MNTKPFEHLIIDDFLSEEDFSVLCEVLGELSIERKESDLFQFDQSQELANNEQLAFFKEKLLALSSEQKFGISSQKIDMFAAFYFDTDYLLPHDDRLDTRKVAYTFYVAAPENGGNLALIDTKKPHKKTRVAVLPNRLVLFKVSENSLHEVEEVQGELPRISLSGWFH